MAAVAVSVKDEGGHVEGGIALGVKEGEKQFQLDSGQSVRLA